MFKGGSTKVGGGGVGGGVGGGGGGEWLFEAALYCYSRFANLSSKTNQMVKNKKNIS